MSLFRPEKRTAQTVASRDFERAPRLSALDDNRDAAESLAMLLRMDGHEVTVVHDGQEALAAFHAMQPEVALLAGGGGRQLPWPHH